MKLKIFNYTEYYKHEFNKFLQQSSIHGLRFLVLHTSVKYTRILWSFLMVSVVFWTHFIIVNLIIDYLQQPTEIHMSTKVVHVENSEFPAVAICSANKIRKTKLIAFAKEVFQAQQEYSPNLLANDVESMAKNLLIIVNFFLYPFDEPLLELDRLTKLHGLLSYMQNYTTYSPRDVLRQLGPDCEELIVRGMIFGDIVDTKKFIFQRITSTSVCCSFNYKRRSYANDPTIYEIDNELLRKAPQIKFQSNSILNSIQFVLQSNPDEFVYKEMANDAFQLYIFPQNDYAMLQSTRVGDILVDHNTIVEIPIQPKFFEANPAVRQFSPKLRQCYYPEEGEKLLNQSYYSIDECLMYCRIESMIRHCGCVAAPMIQFIIKRKKPMCSLMELPCLMRWKSVWYNWNYFDYVNKADEKSEEKKYVDTFERCAHCLPTCNGVNYDITVNVFPLEKAVTKIYHRGLLKGFNNDKPLSIIKLYFQKRFAQSTEMNIVGNWMVLLNRFGGIMGLMYGFSLISYIEILYFLTGNWLFNIYYEFNKKLRMNSKPPFNNLDVDKDVPPEYKLYWQELMPKGIKPLHE